MEIPLFTFLLLYLIGVALFLLWTFFNVYHIVKFGMFDFTGKLNLTIFICFSLIIFGMTALLLQDVPWLDSVNILELLQLPTLTGSSSFDL